jgi:predicted ATPase
MLKRIELRSFKAFDTLDVQLKPFTVLVGTNGTGKTTLLQAIEFLASLVTGTIDTELDARTWLYGDLVHKLAPRNAFGFTAHLEFDGRPLTWAIDLHKRRGSYIAAESVRSGRRLVLRRRGREMARLDETTSEWETVSQSLQSSWISTVDDDDKARYPDLVKISRWARAVRPYVELSPAMLRRSSRRTADGIGQFGENLAGFLRYLADNRASSYRDYVNTVKRYYRHLDRIVIRSPGAGWNRLEMVERWGKQRLSLSSDQVSDGFLRLCAIAAMSYVNPPPTMLMMDEVENGVHPRLLGSLMGLLQELAEKDTQVLVTTHSPIALNSVNDADSVLIVRRTQSGRSRLVQLSGTDGYKVLNSVFRPGEMWVNLGEETLIKRPSPRSLRQ